MRQKMLVFALPVMALLGACSAPAGPPPPFALEPARTVLELEPGGSVSSFVGLERRADFGGTVRMTFQNLPPGFSQTWRRDTANGDCSLRLSADADAVPGTYTLKLTGAAPAAQPSARATGRRQPASPPALVQQDLRVVLNPERTGSPSFALSLDANVVTVAPGGGETTFVRLKLLRGFAERITLNVLNRQPPVNINFLPNELQGAPNATDLASEVFLAVPGSTPPGRYRLVVAASSPSLSRTTDLLVVVPER